MLAELALLAGLGSGCDVTLAALGICSSQCEESEVPNGSFSLCASKEEKSTTSKPATKPMRECRYYVNGTIDVPTQTIITAWVEVGSRLCIGDEPVEPKIVYKTVTEQLDDIFSARAKPPVAFTDSRTKPEPFEPIRLWVDVENQQHNGSLFGEPAQIRFRAEATRWEFSEGSDGYGRAVTIGFSTQGNHWAQASVRFSVDYETGGKWTFDAAEFWLSSNRINFYVYDPPRRTLLVNPEG
jgi:hypothetical protein